jgi:hypothetical protein
LWDNGSHQTLYAYGSLVRPAALSALRIATEQQGHLEIQLSGRGYSGFEVLARDAQQKNWRPLGSGRMIDGTISEWRDARAEAQKALCLRVRAKEVCGRVQEWGPFLVSASDHLPVVQAHTRDFTPGLLGWLISLPFSSVLVPSRRID